MRCYLSRKSKPELKKILNSFIEKSKKIENDFANNKLTGLKDEYLNDEYLNKAAVSMYDVLISFKRKIIFNMLKLLDHEDFVFYINEVNQREGNYFLKRMELSKWSFS